MKFIITKTRPDLDQEDDETQPHPEAKRVELAQKDFRDVWVLELATLEDLIDFVEQYGDPGDGVVVSRKITLLATGESVRTIEIYNSWR